MFKDIDFAVYWEHFSLIFYLYHFIFTFFIFSLCWSCEVINTCTAGEAFECISNIDQTFLLFVSHMIQRRHWTLPLSLIITSAVPKNDKYIVTAALRDSGAYYLLHKCVWRANTKCLVKELQCSWLPGSFHQGFHHFQQTLRRCPTCLLVFVA